MSRHENTERIGVYVTGLKFTEELDWIFREQTIADVGIDALVEQKINGDPTGKFLAIQIKTGKANFHDTSKYLVHYVSNIHYHYWLNSNLPVVLVAHLPEFELTVWEHISAKNLLRTKKQWKINIPKSKTLDEKAKKEFSKILEGVAFDDFTNQIKDKSSISIDISDEIDQEIESINEAGQIINDILELFLELGEKTQVMTDKIGQYGREGRNERDKVVLKCVKDYSGYLNKFTVKVNKELDDFAYFFSEGFGAYRKLVLVNYQINNDFEAIKNSHSILTETHKGMKDSIIATYEFKNEVLTLPKKYAHLKKSRSNLLETSDQILKEFRVASDFLADFLNDIEDLIDSNGI